MLPLSSLVTALLAAAPASAAPLPPTAPVDTAVDARPLPPGRIARAEALRRVATHVCLTTLATDALAEQLEGCVEQFAREVIVDPMGECDAYGVREAKLPFCQAAVANWILYEQGGDSSRALVALVKAYSRCSGATLCRPDARADGRGEAFGGSRR